MSKLAIQISISHSLKPLTYLLSFLTLWQEISIFEEEKKIKEEEKDEDNMDVSPGCERWQWLGKKYWVMEIQNTIQFSFLYLISDGN